MIVKVSIRRIKNCFNDNSNKLPIHEKLQELNPSIVMMDFDATSVYILLLGGMKIQ